MFLQEELFMKFAEFEEKVKEVDRARAIYRYALDHIPKAQVSTVLPLLDLTISKPCRQYKPHCFEHKPVCRRGLWLAPVCSAV